MKLLHIIGTPREASSNTLPLAAEFIDALRVEQPDLEVSEVDLFRQDLPAVAGSNIEVKYTLMMGGPIDRAHAESWARIESLIEDFLSADAILLTSPMWNFSIPYALKYYIDCLVQPGYVFKYNEQGYPVPLVHGKRMLCITSRGGDYSVETPMHAYDFQEPYLRSIFGFIGVTDMEFVNVQPMDVTPELRAAAVAGAQARLADLSAAWLAPVQATETVS
ncbi:MAG: NAD(P)H-dependent oxidoreductase [Nocardioides sp.]|uniref:FMN-dependent NADH-azoreductase n=1 Tax=Nocardioides sp. TaxID=35761 RepID=UPI0032658940